MSVFSKLAPGPQGPPGPMGPQGPAGVPGATPEFSRLITAEPSAWVAVEMSAGASYPASVLRLSSLNANDSHVVVRLLGVPAGSTGLRVIEIPDYYLGRILLEAASAIDSTFYVLTSSNLKVYPDAESAADLVQFSGEVARFSKRRGDFAAIYEVAQSPAPSRSGWPGRPTYLISASTYVPAWSQVLMGSISAAASAGAVVHTAAFPAGANIDLRFGADPVSGSPQQIYAMQPGAAGWPAGLVLGLRFVSKLTNATVTENTFNGTTWAPALTASRTSLLVGASQFLQIVVVTPPTNRLACNFSLKVDALASKEA